MAKEKSDKADGGGSRFARYVPLMIILGIVLSVGGIRLFCPTLWENYYIPILLIAAGLAIPFLFSPWKFWAGYGFQVGIAPGLAFVLMGVFVIFFGYWENVLWDDAVLNLILTNSIILAAWLVLVFATFRSRKDTMQQKKKQDAERNQIDTQQDYRKGEFWRDYRWIIAPAVLILLFLFDTSWAQSTLSTASLKKTVIASTSPASVQFHAEYPSRILFDETNPSEIHLWMTGSTDCVNLEISADGVLFAIKPPPDTPLKWNEKLTLKLDKTTTATTLLMQPSKPPETYSRTVWLSLISGGNHLTTNWKIIIESKRDWQIRDWKKNFLGTGSTVVSLITAVFVGIKQLDEEKKRRKNEQIKEAITNFEADAIKDFSKALQKHLELTADWNEWDRELREKFKDKYSLLFDKNIPTFWYAITDKAVDQIKRDVDLCLRVWNRIFENEKEKTNITLELVQSALQGDANALPLMLTKYPASIDFVILIVTAYSDIFQQNIPALLSILKEHPASINRVSRIVSTFPVDLKMKIAACTIEFPEQIRALRVELGFFETESFPLQAQFTFHAKEHSPTDQLTAWLNAHDLTCSPFADAESPFYSVFDKQLLMDWADPRFGLPAPNLQFAAFEFANSWDAGAALFEYCKALQSNVRLKEDLFFAIVTPGIVEKYDAEHSRKLLLHALAEQWLWSLAEAPTLFYTLKDAQRDLAGRLLRWHDFSPSIAVNKIAEFAKHLQEEVFFSKIVEWLTDASADDLRTEEINALIGLRPLPKKRTLFLISTIDLNPYATGQIPSSLHETMNEQSDWLSAHDCGLVRFLTATENDRTVSISALVAQCNIRVQKCSKSGNVVFNQLFDAPGIEPDAILAQKANGSPGRMVRLGQKLLLQHVKKYPLDKPLQIEDLIALR
ncbi:MAG: hypothetical protein ACOYYI_17800 [Chloroflexota bacterium]